jgi:hypothetical protein
VFVADRIVRETVSDRVAETVRRALILVGPSEGGVERIAGEEPAGEEPAEEPAV